MNISLLRLWRDAGSLWRIFEYEVGEVYERLIAVLAIFAGIILVEWGLNAFVGLMGLNHIFFFLGGAAILIIGFRPIQGIGTGAGLGGLYALFSDTDFSQGIRNGVFWWSRLILSLLFTWFLVTGFLATWSFERNPWAFFPVLAASMMIVTTTTVFRFKRTFLPYFVIGYAALVIISSLWTTTAAGERERIGGVRETSRAPVVVEVPKCTRVTPFDPNNITPKGDWCFGLTAGMPITIRPTARTEVLPAVEETEVGLYNQNQELLRTVVLTPGGCQPLGGGWSYFTITPKQSGVIRVRIGQDRPLAGC